MPMLEQRIQQHFIDSADLKYQAAQSLTKPVADAIQAVLACVTSGGKVLTCGNAGSAADAQNFSARFVGRFERDGHRGGCCDGRVGHPGRRRLRDLDG